VLLLFRKVTLRILFTFSSLMTRTRQQLAVFVLSHFFSAFLDDAAQPITSLLYLSKAGPARNRIRRFIRFV